MIPRTLIKALMVAGLLVGCDEHRRVPLPAPQIVPSEALHTPHDRQFRASWIATTLNLDWPPAATLPLPPADRIVAQQKALMRIVEEAQALNLNAIIFQVKPDGGVLYPSALLPWSTVLTGQPGGDPGFDPLAFLIAAAHRHNIAVHAWLNPYRVSMHDDAASRRAMMGPDDAPTLYGRHPQWLRSAGGRLVLDPGMTAGRELLVAVVGEILARYDVDGIHLDDYFYSETAASPLDDSATFAHAPAGFTHKGDWRRNNTLLLISELSKTIRARHPWVAFGISPAGVWRNQAQDPRGSASRSGLPAYDVSYADTRRWVREGLVDYIVPQIYWGFERQAAPYSVLAQWWADQVAGFPVQLYIGNALYKVGEVDAEDRGWYAGDELTRQLTFNQQTPGIQGSVLFRHGLLGDPRKQPAVQALRQQLWHHPALIPPMPWKPRHYLTAPVALSLQPSRDTTRLRWQESNRAGTVSYALYYVSPEWPTDRSSGQLLATPRRQSGSQSWQDSHANTRGPGRYAITAVDGNHNESPAALFP